MKARGCSIDILRSETSRKRREDHCDRYAERARPPDIDTVVIASEAARELRRAVASLPQGEAAAIELAFFQGMSYSAVAVHLNIAEGTAKSRIRSGLRRLSVVLQPHAGDRRASPAFDNDGLVRAGQPEPA